MKKQTEALYAIPRTMNYDQMRRRVDSETMQEQMDRLQTTVLPAQSGTYIVEPKEDCDSGEIVGVERNNLVVAWKLKSEETLYVANEGSQVRTKTMPVTTSGTRWNRCVVEHPEGWYEHVGTDRCLETQLELVTYWRAKRAQAEAKEQRRAAARKQRRTR